jgi:hypothetical protein
MEILVRSFTPAASVPSWLLNATRIIFTLLFLFCLPAKASECLAYSANTMLVGTLTKNTFPGPPNYESIAAGDRQETYFFLKLKTPLCVTPGNDATQMGASKVKIIQLIFPDTEDSYASLRPFLGKKLSCSGQIWPQETGHHHSAVLLAEAMCRYPTRQSR